MDKPTPIFAEGLMFRRPKEGSPKWIKGSMSVNAGKFRQFMEDNIEHMSENGWFTIDLKESSKEGKNLYFQLNTWKPEAKGAAKDSKTSKGANGEEIDNESIPF